MSDSAAPISSVFTCISCKVAFGTAEAQRLHYQSDWHRYNLKRKVADLPPVDLAQFQQKDQGNNHINDHGNGGTAYTHSSLLFSLSTAQKAAAQKQEETPVFKGYCEACR